MTAWTTLEVRRLQDAVKGGVPIKEIAQRHNRTTAAIHNRLHRIGKQTTTIKRRRWSAADDDALREAVKSDLPLVAVAAQMDRTLVAVRVRLLRLKTPPEEAAP